MKHKKTKSMIRNRILDYMTFNCKGFRNAKHVEEIKFNLHLRGLDLGERTLRKFMSDLRKEGHLASSTRDGVWSVPLYTRDRDEIDAIRHGLFEKKKHALSELEGINKAIRELEESLGCEDLFRK